MEASSSSKVTVEYHDPSGVFPLISRDIAARLPLRNLNWQSQARPLRQIKSLHVEFVPDSCTESALRPNIQRIDSNGPNSDELVRNGENQHKKAATAAAGKQRRHQIPGLKTSPYLKLYVLRCDDKDTYKSDERKKLREWLKNNTQPEGKREKHDAFEWMIIHVVVPDTIASSEPRWRESTRDPDELKERSKSNIKLPGKSTRTVFDKLRADFNESSKAGPDRIAQIRLLKKSMSVDLLPTPALAKTLEETPQERENAWADLIKKFKDLILIPFDARVRQYEEDIAEQESRRSLPGWNFCTFFIHKEGLARALESVGLVEDALAIYDELALGLETVIRDLATGAAEGTATSFEDWTKDLKQRILGKAAANGTSEGKSMAEEKALSLFDKDYREDIVRSQISVFDFFCYLFSRQKALILRLAGAQLARDEFGNNYKEGGEDLVLLAEVCWRALAFVHNTARTLRQDLINGSDKTNISPADVEALVSGWTSSAAAQVLAETDTPLLDPSTDIVISPKAATNGASKRPDFGFAMGANPYPARSSSLFTGPKRAPPSSSRISSPGPQSPQSPPPNDKVKLEEGTYGPQGAAGGLEMKVPDKPGLVELSAYRAELVMVRRKMLELLAQRRGWMAGWAMMELVEDKAGTAEVNLDDEARIDDGGPADAKAVSTLLTPALSSALADEQTFQSTFEVLSDTAVKLYFIATHQKSAETIMGDIAILRYQQDDFVNAAKYFEHVLPLYSSNAWSLMEAQATSILLRSLRELDRKEDFVTNAIKLLTKVARTRSARPGFNRQGAREANEMPDKGYLLQLLDISSDLDAEIKIPLVDFFDDVELDHHFEHFPDRDGFRYRFRFHHVLSDDLALDEVSVRLLHVDDSQMEIWLNTPEPVTARNGLVEVELNSGTSTFGAFYIDRIILKAKQLRFTHELAPKREKSVLIIEDSDDAAKAKGAQSKRPFLMLFPPTRGFEAKVDLSAHTHMERTKHLEIQLASGWNDIEKVDVRLKPKSAGLRLHVADTKVEGAERRADNTPKPGFPGSVNLGPIARDSEAKLLVPYTVEHAATELFIQLEAYYTTATGDFTFASSVKLPTTLPLDVDVNDLFRLDKLFSTFTVRTTNRFPLAISSAKLEEGTRFAVEAPPVDLVPATVFDATPLSLTYKITRKEGEKPKGMKKESPLSLKVHYRAVNDTVLSLLMRAFGDALESSDFSHLRRLLLPLVRERMRHRFTSSGLEEAYLLGVIKLPSFADLGWFEIIDTLPTTVQRPLSDWLMQWHIEHPHLELGQDPEDGDSEEKSITLAVDVPNLDVVFSANLALQEPGLTGGADAEHVIKIGQPVKLELQLRHTRIWSAKDTNDAKAGKQGTEFVFDIQAEPDIWLLGGPKRKHISIPFEDSDQPMTFSLVLIPMELGLHALPQIDVQPVGGEDDVPGAEASASCETFCESAGKVVKVIRGSSTARARIVEGGSASEDG